MQTDRQTDRRPTGAHVDEYVGKIGDIGHVITDDPVVKILVMKLPDRVEVLRPIPN